MCYACGGVVVVVVNDFVSGLVGLCAVLAVCSATAGFPGGGDDYLSLRCYNGSIEAPSMKQLRCMNAWLLSPSYCFARFCEALIDLPSCASLFMQKAARMFVF